MIALVVANLEVARKYGLAPELNVVTVTRLSDHPNLLQIKLAVLAELAQMPSTVLSKLLRPLVMCAVNTIVIRLAIPAQ